MNEFWNESQHVVIPYEVDALDNEDSITKLLNSLVTLLHDGEATFPTLPYFQNSEHVPAQDVLAQVNKDLEKITTENIDRKMSKKNTIRLTESDLKRVISESVKKIVNEGYASSPYKDYNEIDNIHGRGNDENSRGMLFSKGMQLIYKALNTKKDEWNYAKNDWDRNIPTADKNEEKYFDAINKHLKSIEGIWRLWQKQQTQKTGTLPIDNY